MKIDKAIEILEVERRLAERQPETGIHDAIKLGIEALREVKRLRSYKAFHVQKILPGEREE